MPTFFKRFHEDDDGAVTADWVVLTAAIVGLGIASITVIAGAATPQAENLGQYLKDKKLGP